MDNEKTQQEIESQIEDIRKQIEIERLIQDESNARIERFEMQKLKLINLLPQDEFEDLED